jgi:hypothetical protein
VHRLVVLTLLLERDPIMTTNVRKTWETPNLEVFGSMPELTAQAADPNPEGAPNAKLPGTFDGSPFQVCPPGQYKMGDACSDGFPGVS